MKDWLASLIRTKRNLSARLQQSGDGAFEKVASVVTAFKPFLTTLGLATGEFPADLVADALFRYLSDKANSVENAGVLSTLKAEECGTQKTKSGRLDKLSDDVLGVVLPFLGIRDRCLGVERVCRRLFEASRKFPIHCKEPPLSIQNVLLFSTKLRVANRICPRKLQQGEATAVFSMREVTRYAPSVETLCFFGSQMDSIIFASDFPKLRRVVASSESEENVGQLCRFLKRHPTVSHLTYRPWNRNDGPEIIKVIAQNRNLRCVTLNICSLDSEMMQQMALLLGYDLTHVTTLKLDLFGVDSDWRAALQPLFHECLQSLTLFSAPFPALLKMPRLKTPKLKTLQIYDMPFSDLRDFFHALSAEKLDVCALECEVSDLAEILISCPPTKCLKCDIVIDEDTDTEQVMECLTEALNSGLIRVESLRTFFRKKSHWHWQSPSTRTVRTWINQNTAQLSVHL